MVSVMDELSTIMSLICHYFNPKPRFQVSTLEIWIKVIQLYVSQGSDAVESAKES